MPSAGLLGSAYREFTAAGLNFEGLGLAWARVLPTVVLVPAFGLRGMPTVIRLTTGVALAVCIAPGLSSTPTAGAMVTAWPIALLRELARGLPVAIAAAVPLWTATMMGGTIDALRGVGEQNTPPLLEGRASPLGNLFALLASFAFLASGGPARVALSLLTVSGDLRHPILQAALALSSGIQLAVALASPLVAASFVIEISLALLARAASPTQMHALLAQIRSVALLAVVALLWQRFTDVLLALGRHAGG